MEITEIHLNAIHEVAAAMRMTLNDFLTEEVRGTDEEVWPKKMDLRLFKQWFHVKVHDVVLDIGKKLKGVGSYGRKA